MRSKWCLALWVQSQRTNSFPYSPWQAMGATCCKSETAPSSDATVDARPAMDSSLQVLPPVAGGNTEKERVYSVKLTKSGDRKLGLDVDFMAERVVLPIMTVTGGVAEVWNQEHPELPISKGEYPRSQWGIRWCRSNARQVQDRYGFRHDAVQVLELWSLGRRFGEIGLQQGVWTNYDSPVMAWCRCLQRSRWLPKRCNAFERQWWAWNGCKCWFARCCPWTPAQHCWQVRATLDLKCWFVGFGCKCGNQDDGRSRCSNTFRQTWCDKNFRRCARCYGTPPWWWQGCPAFEGHFCPQRFRWQGDRCPFWGPYRWHVSHRPIWLWGPMDF